MVEGGGGGRENKTRKSIFKIHLCCLFMAYLLLICPHLSIAALFFRFFPFLFSVVFFFSICICIFIFVNEIEIWVVGAQSDSDSALIFFRASPLKKTPSKIRKIRDEKTPDLETHFHFQQEMRAKFREHYWHELLTFSFAMLHFLLGSKLLFFVDFFFRWCTLSPHLFGARNWPKHSYSVRMCGMSHNSARKIVPIGT